MDGDAKLRQEISMLSKLITSNGYNSKSLGPGSRDRFQGFQPNHSRNRRGLLVAPSKTVPHHRNSRSQFSLSNRTVSNSLINSVVVTTSASSSKGSNPYKVVNSSTSSSSTSKAKPLPVTNPNPYKLVRNEKKNEKVKSPIRNRNNPYKLIRGNNERQLRTRKTSLTDNNLPKTSRSQANPYKLVRSRTKKCVGACSGGSSTTSASASGSRHQNPYKLVRNDGLGKKKVSKGSGSPLKLERRRSPRKNPYKFIRNHGDVVKPDLQGPYKRPNNPYKLILNRTKKIVTRAVLTQQKRKLSYKNPNLTTPKRKKRKSTGESKSRYFKQDPASQPVVSIIPRRIRLEASKPEGEEKTKEKESPPATITEPEPATSDIPPVRENPQKILQRARLMKKVSRLQEKVKPKESTAPQFIAFN